MKLLYSWLGEYVDLSGHTDDDVVDALARLGLPVEEVVRSTTVAGVITARVERIERHPDAAKVIRVWATTRAVRCSRMSRSLTARFNRPLAWPDAFLAARRPLRTTACASAIACSARPASSPVIRRTAELVKLFV